MNIADRYAEMREVARVRERALFPAEKIPSELELQARWFAGDFGNQFVTTGGDKIDIVQFGVWNRESGPDFSDAAVRFNGGEPIRGCIEFDLTDRNWEAHGHSANPAFENTVLHVFVHESERKFFTRTQSNRFRTSLSALPKTSLSSEVSRSFITIPSSPFRSSPWQSAHFFISRRKFCAR